MSIAMILCIIGIIGFSVCVVWWIVEIILDAITKKDKHFVRMWVACLMLNLFNLLLQISHLFIK